MRFAEREPKPLERGVIKQIIDAIDKLPSTRVESGCLKYSIEWMAEELNGPILVRLNGHFRNLERNEADLVDFVKIIVEELKEEDKELMLLIICAIDFFKRVSETYGLKNTIAFKDVTNFLIEVWLIVNQQITDKDKDSAVIKTKVVALKNHFSHVDEVRSIDVNPPILFGNSQVGIKRLKKDKTIVDKNVEKKGFILK
jgi:hypothetical protein